MIALDMANGRTAPLTDNAFARWLAAQVDGLGMARGTYRPLETAMIRRGLKVGAGQIWDYMHGGKLPTRPVSDRFAAFFGWDPNEVWGIRVRAQHEQDAAFLRGPAGVRLDTAPAVSGSLSHGGAEGAAGTEAAILAEVARPLLTGDMTPEELRYLQDFARRVTRRLAAAGVRDDAGRGGAAGEDDPD
jgi:hypothetical protein